LWLGNKKNSQNETTKMIIIDFRLRVKVGGLGLVEIAGKAEMMLENIVETEKNRNGTMRRRE
jgi:hypothetical protein